MISVLIPPTPCPVHLCREVPLSLQAVYNSPTIFFGSMIHRKPCHPPAHHSHHHRFHFIRKPTPWRILVRIRHLTFVVQSPIIDNLMYGTTLLGNPMLTSLPLSGHPMLTSLPLLGNPMATSLAAGKQQLRRQTLATISMTCSTSTLRTLLEQTLVCIPHSVSVVSSCPAPGVLFSPPSRGPVQSGCSALWGCVEPRTEDEGNAEQ